MSNTGLGVRKLTRINVIPPAELTGKHLVAEYRELPRVFNLTRAYARRSGKRDDLPASYTLGKGHVKFFYNKLLWLSWRHIALVNEMERRGYKPQFKENLRVTHDDIAGEWYGDYEPTAEAMAINRARIEERLKGGDAA